MVEDRHGPRRVSSMKEASGFSDASKSSGGWDASVRDDEEDDVEGGKFFEK